MSGMHSCTSSICTSYVCVCAVAVEAVPGPVLTPLAANVAVPAVESATGGVETGVESVATADGGVHAYSSNFEAEARQSTVVAPVEAVSAARFAAVLGLI